MAGPLVAIDARLVGARGTGDTTYWTGLLHGLASVDSEHRFLLLSNAPRPAGIPDEPRFRWRCVPAASARWWSLVTFPVQARRLGASLAHVQYTLSPLVKRGVTTVHDVSFLVGPEWFRPKDRLLLSRSIPASVHRAVRVITVSETSRAEIEKAYPAAASKTRVTPLAPHPAIRPMDRGEARSRVSARFGLDGPFLLSVGTRWPRKNMSLAVEAVRGLPDALPHRLALTGKAGWGEEPEHPRVLRTGYVDEADLSALYSAADLYLAPSYHEGFGLPLVEAFLCGCPVLCSSGGALPETAGDAACVEPTFDPAHWSQTIRRLLEDSSNLESMRARGHARAATFTWVETARKTLDVYREAAP